MNKDNCSYRAVPGPDCDIHAETHATVHKKGEGVATNKIVHYSLLVLLSLVMFLPGITRIPIWDRDSAHYAQATKQMLESHNYWRIRFQNHPRHLKPPGIYWLQAAAVQLFSANNIYQVWAYRIPSVLGGVLAVLLTFLFAKRYFREKIAFWAAAFLAVSLLLILETHMTITDAPLLATMVLMQGSLWCIYVRYRQNQTIGWVWPLLFWLAMGAGFLIKGLTPLIATLTIVGITLIDRDVKWLKALRATWGIPIFLLSASWLIPVSLESHSNFLLDMLRKDALPKVLHGAQSHGAPPGFYLLLLPLSFWPASLFIWHGIVWTWRQRRIWQVRFLMTWIIAVWIFYAIVHTKLPQYLLPVYPAIAMLCAAAVIGYKRRPLVGTANIIARISYLIWGIFGIAMAAFFIYFPHALTGYYNQASVLSASIIVVMIVLCVATAWRTRFDLTLKISIAGAAVSLFLMAHLVLPSLTNFWVTDKIVKAVAQQIPHTLSSNNPLLSTYYREPSLVFALGTHNVVMTILPQAEQRIANSDHAVLLVGQQQLPILQQFAKKQDLFLQILATIHGFEYPKGRWVHLSLILLQ